MSTVSTQHRAHTELIGVDAAGRPCLGDRILLLPSHSIDSFISQSASTCWDVLYVRGWGTGEADLVLPIGTEDAEVSSVWLAEQY